ncbi:MAG: glycosyltransferase family 2 protein [Ruminococcus sp.]
MPTFSIIVPVYNTEQFLDKCVSSILAQTYDDFELILVDDGSPDNCPEICDKYVQIDSRIKVLHKKNGGVSSARNLGMSVARGTYIWFIDSDDYIEPFSLQRLFEVQNSYNAELYVFNNGTVCGLCSENINDFFKKYYFTYVIGFGPCNKLYKRDVIEANNLQFDTQETIGEDLLFNINYYKAIFSSGVKDIYFVGEDYYYYVERDNSAMNTASKGRIYQQLRLFDKILKSMSGVLSEDYLSYLFILHLLSGIGQSAQDGLSSKEFAETDLSKYHKWLKVFKKMKELFFANEHTGIPGKIRINIFLHLMLCKKYKFAGRIIGLK